MAQKTATLLMPAEVGRLVGAKYELVRRLGQGSMGEVWIARHRTLDERVAVKLLSAAPQLGQIEDGPTAAARFQFEAQVAARLSRHTRHIVRVTDHGEEGPLAYLVMELLEGYTLETTIMRRGCLTPAEVSTILVQIARGLGRAHAEGVIHRDLKPANIFLARDEDGAVLVKLLDFGIARLIRGHRTTSCFSTSPNIVFGTPGYMSPEHAYPISRPDHHCDLWGAATVAYEALTGDLPVPGFSTDELLENLRVRRFVPVLQRTPHLPKALEGFFERAFAERIEDRHANAADLASAFARAAGIPNEGPRTGEERRPAPDMTLRSMVAAPPRRTKVFIAAVATTVVAGVVGASLALARRASPSTTAPAPVAQQASVVDSRGSPTPKPTSPIAQVAAESGGGETSADAPRATASAPKERGAEVSPTAPESASTARPGCSPPYEFDAHGYKRWKRRCF